MKLRLRKPRRDGRQSARLGGMVCDMYLHTQCGPCNRRLRLQASQQRKPPCLQCLKLCTPRGRAGSSEAPSRASETRCLRAQVRRCIAGAVQQRNAQTCGLRGVDAYAICAALARGQRLHQRLRHAGGTRALAADAPLVMTALVAAGTLNCAQPPRGASGAAYRRARGGAACA